MKMRNLIVASTLAAGLAVAAASDAHARGHGGFGRGFDGSPGMAFEGTGSDGFGQFRGVMRGLDLTDEQRDKIFDIMHAQAPATRDKMNELRKAREELRAAATAKSYDAKKVRELANAQAKAMADLIVMRAETFSKIYGLLTPEQQKKVEELKDGNSRPARRR